MKKIDPSVLTEAQIDVICLAINRKGNGQHPVAEARNLEYFEKGYAIDCLSRARCNFNPTGLAVAETAIEMLAKKDPDMEFVDQLNRRLDQLFEEE